MSVSLMLLSMGRPFQDQMASQEWTSFKLKLRRKMGNRYIITCSSNHSTVGSSPWCGAGRLMWPSHVPRLDSPRVGLNQIVVHWLDNLLFCYDVIHVVVWLILCLADTERMEVFGMGDFHMARLTGVSGLALIVKPFLLVRLRNVSR